MSDEIYDELHRLRRERNVWRALAIGFGAAFAVLVALGGVFALFQLRAHERVRHAEMEARQQAVMAAQQAEEARQQAEKALRKERNEKRP